MHFEVHQGLPSLIPNCNMQPAERQFETIRANNLKRREEDEAVQDGDCNLASLPTSLRKTN